MGQTSCNYPNCKSSYRKLKNTGIKKSFHKFPRDLKYLEAWLKFSKMNKKDYNLSLILCSDHFEDDCFIKDYKSELLNLPLRKRLKPEAIPTRSVPEIENLPERQKKNKKRSKKMLVDELLMENEHAEIEIVNEHDETEIENKHDEIEFVNLENFNVESLMSEIEKQKKEIILLHTEKENMVKQHKEEIQRIKTEYENDRESLTKSFEETINNFKELNYNYIEKIKQMLSHSLTSNQQIDI